MYCPLIYCTETGKTKGQDIREFLDKDFVARHTGFKIPEESQVRIQNFSLARAKWKNSDSVMLCMAFYWQHLGFLLGPLVPLLNQTAKAQLQN